MNKELVTLKSSVRRLKRDFQLSGGELKNHAFLDNFPTMSLEQLQGLANDILENGLREKILLNHDGTVLIDGRNRLRACGVAGVEPRFSFLPKNTPEAEIVRIIANANIRTRNFTPGQLAFIGLEIADAITGVPISDLKNYPITKSYDSRTPRSYAAAVIGVSSKTVWQAAVLRTHNQEVETLVRSGELRLNTAYEMVMDERGLRTKPRKARPDGLTDTPPRGRDNSRRAVEARRAWLRHLAVDKEESVIEIAKVLDITDKHVRKLANRYQIPLPGDAWSYKRRKLVFDVSRIAQVVADDLVAMEDSLPRIRENIEQLDEDKAKEFAKIYYRAARQLRNLAQALQYGSAPMKRKNDDDGDYDGPASA